MKRKATELTIDENLTEMRPINAYFVSRYRQAMRNGAKFPAVIIEKGTNRIVSGNHRVTAYIQEFGDDVQIEVKEKEFASESELLRFFAEENSSHGNPLSGWSEKSIAQKLLELGDDPQEIGRVLNIPVSKVKKIGGLNVWVIGSDDKKEMKPVKHGLEHMAGHTVQNKEYETHKNHDRGVPARQQVDQLIRWIDSGWIDWENEYTYKSFQLLYNRLDKIMSKEVV